MDRQQRRSLTDYSLTILAAMLLLQGIVVQPLVAMGLIHGHWAVAVFMAALALAVWLLFDRTRVGKVFVLLAFLSVVLRVADARHPDAGLRQWEIVLGAGSLLMLTWLTLIYTLAPGPMNLHRVFGAIAAYMLFGMSFAELHKLVALQFADAYLLFGQPADAARLMAQLDYFSFVTLTSLGFGDVTPQHPLARSLTVLEAVVGVLYPAALLGWMVSMMGRRPVS
jgi:hypothetical protein